MEDDRPMDHDIQERSFEREQERAGLVETPVASARRFRLPAALKDRWQVPLVLVSILAILGAAWVHNERNGGPSTTQLLLSASACIERNELEEASSLLAEAEPRLDGSKIALEARFHATVGDWHAATAGDILSASNPKALAIVGAYSRAKACGWTPDEPQALALADGLVASGRRDQAEKAYRMLTESTRNAIALTARTHLRGVIRSRIDDAQRDRVSEEVPALLDAFMALEPLPAEEAWASATRAEYLLKTGQHQSLDVQLVVAMRRLEAIDDGSIEWAPLHVLLGRAYVATGRPGPAAERFRFALEDLRATGAPRGDALAFLGSMHLDAGDAALAEENFLWSIQTEEATTAALDQSRLGLARSLARQGRHDEAAAALSSALAARSGPDEFVAQSIAKAARDEGLAAILLASEHDLAQATTLLNAAITYAGIAADAAFGRDAQRDALRLKGVAHETLARTTLRPLIGSMDPRDAPLGAVSLSSRIEANHDFVAAGEAYLQLDALADAGSVESDGRLLWDAATAFDMGGRPTIAIPLYERYVSERPVDDDARPEALFRLALASHALLDLEGASAWYRLLIAEAEDVDPLLSTSSYSTRARVGLARCLAGGEHPTDTALEEAEGHLRMIVDGRGVVGPDAPEYREAMFQLGRVLYARHKWPEAVEVLETTLKRYAGDVRVPEFSARAGLAWTALAGDATAQLEQTPLSPGHRADVEAAQGEALEASIERFGAAIAALDAPSMAVLDPLQQHLLRASYLRRADALATLGRYDEAMEEYASIERRFGEEMTAIEALVRMSNLALENGDPAAAQRATVRAATKLRHLDTIGFEGPGLLDGIGTDALAQWITLQPPGGRDNGAID